MLISTSLLTEYHACKDPVELFNQVFPKGIDSKTATLDDVLLAVDRGLSIQWFVNNFFPVTAQEVYYRATAPAREDYFKAIAPACEAFDRTIAPDREAYLKGRTPDEKDYLKATEIAWAAYIKAIAPALKAYYRVIAPTFLTELKKL